MMNSPLVTIIIPVYNVEKYIDRCLDSLFLQTYLNIEYIFVDDCTPDNSITHIYEKLDLYPKRKSAVHVLKHSINRGLTAARQTGLQYASGDFVWHIDSDDFIALDAVELLVNKALTTNSDMVIFYAEELYKNFKKNIFQPEPIDKDAYLYYVLTRRLRFELCFRFCKRSIYQGIELDTEVCFGEDYATVPRLIFNASKITLLNHVCYYYVKYNSISYTSSINLSSVKSMEKAIVCLEKFFFEKDKERFTSWINLSKIYVKIHLLKMSYRNRDVFRYVLDLYPQLTRNFFADISFENRLLLFLAVNKFQFALRVYICMGVLIRNILNRCIEK